MSQLKTQNNPADSQSVISAQWQGPIPPPDALRQFDDVIPGSAERILRMAEIEQLSRLEFDKNNQVNDTAITKRGQWLGSLIALGAIAAAVYTAYIQAHWAVSCALVGVPILSTVKAIVKK